MATSIELTPPLFEQKLLDTWFIEPGDEAFGRMMAGLRPEIADQVTHLIESAKRFGQDAIESPVINPKQKKAGVVVFANEHLGVQPVMVVIGDENAEIPDADFGTQKLKYALYALAKLQFINKTGWSASGSNVGEFVLPGKQWTINGDPIPAGAVGGPEFGWWSVATSVFPPKSDEALSLSLMEREQIITPVHARLWAKILGNEIYSQLGF